jgi:hypothetical protein
MKRIFALSVLLIPGIIAIIGIKLMRDMLFGILQPPFPNLIFQFLAGFLFLIFGLGFVAGFVLYRDRKRNKVQKRFKNTK